MRSLFLIGILITASSLLKAADWQTVYEKSHFKATSTYQQTVEFCKQLADSSDWIKYLTFGKSAQGRALPLLIINKDGQFEPDHVHQWGKIIILIQAGIHAGEIDGKDAGLLFLRDLVVKKQHADLFENVVWLFIPIFNVDGHERFGPYNRINQNGPEAMGWRTTAVNLNLNRDFLKADAVEMKAWLKLFNRWLPDFFVDIHVTDGADYQYVLTYNMDTQAVMDKELNRYLAQKIEPALKTGMKKLGFPMNHYIIFRKRHDVKSGLLGWIPWPRFSNGYSLLHNRPGLLIENHMLKDYRTRVTATYFLIQTLLKVLNANAHEFKKVIRQADANTGETSFLEQPFPLTFQRTNDSTMVDFLGFDYRLIKSDLSGGFWFQYDQRKPRSFRIPFFNTFVPEKQVLLPLAYLVPVEWQKVINRLSFHGIQYFKLTANMELELDTYRFEKVKFASKSYEGRQMVNFKTVPIRFKRVYHRGSVLVPLNQPAARVIAHIFEPDGPDSFVRWGFFNAIFERKEYAESYVLEELARKMLQQNVQLAERFQQKMRTDSTFAHNPQMILNWFYQQSPYWDSFKNVYPVGKITDSRLLNQLMKGVE